MYKNLGTYDLIADVLQAVLNTVFYLFLMKGRLKLRDEWVLVIMGTMYSVALFCKYETDLPVALYCLIVLMFVAVQLWMTQREHRVNGYTCYVIWMTLYNMLVGLFVGLSYIIYSVIKTGEAAWYVKSENGGGMYVVMCMSIIISTVLAYIITCRLSSDIFGLRNPMKTVFLVFIPVEGLIAFLLKGMSNQIGEYSDSTSGILALLDLLTIVFAVLAVLILLGLRIRSSLSEKKKLRASLEENRKRYSELQSRKDELEELIHDAGKGI